MAKDSAKDTAKDGKEPGSAPPEQYGDVVGRLEGVVAQLEAGTLSLEDSLKAFEEGIKLVRRGESLLNAAEQRIELLLSEDGKDTAVRLQTGVKPPTLPAAPRKGPPSADEDVPF
ncbi:exodeoxyribonuclease VII small subunit [Aggregicoccus sp. 17bor-14]|uniref:exodeoxyribonuclease VII small subunit n=1 Tax=Myxococcaceae TaxID=31 RepID=UPI0012F2D67A|nr:exodeoxyribonuclease VII small subunit [Simulacricoccus sp. 17bor-14]MRI91299.1 exodeoxyribonuclease VII small subunit [Aggregicoccus sp. 17bor-14]